MAFSVWLRRCNLVLQLQRALFCPIQAEPRSLGALFSTLSIDPQIYGRTSLYSPRGPQSWCLNWTTVAMPSAPCRFFSTSEEDSSEEETSTEAVAAQVITTPPSEPLSPDAIEQAAHIGYRVIGRLMPDDIRTYKPPNAFAVIQIGSHQFKISPGDCIYTEKLKHADVNDKLRLHKVLLLGSRSQTIIGRPIIPKAAVHAVVEEQVLDAKVIIFKKKRRKNYRRTKGHRQELTRLRILDIRGLGERRSARAAVAQTTN